MIPAGYMAKRVCKRPDWLKAEQVVDIYSVSGCNSEFFADYIEHWKHNGYWLFDSPEIIRILALEQSIDLAGTSLFYYEVHELEFDGETWRVFAPEPSFPLNVAPPERKELAGSTLLLFSLETRRSVLPCHAIRWQKKYRPTHIA
jgi:hypothetical protein